MQRAPGFTFASCLPCVFLAVFSVILSEWSEWTPCSPCSPRGSQGGVVSASKLVSIQRRFRACLDLESGQPVSRQEEEESQCPGPLVEERLCPDVNICRGSGSGPARQRKVQSELRESFISGQICSQVLAHCCQAPVAP